MYYLYVILILSQITKASYSIMEMYLVHTDSRHSTCIFWMVNQIEVFFFYKYLSSYWTCSQVMSFSFFHICRRSRGRFILMGATPEHVFKSIKPSDLWGIRHILYAIRHPLMWYLRLWYVKMEKLYGLMFVWIVSPAFKPP